MKTKQLKEYPSLCYGDSMESLCKPLSSQFGIDYFSHVNVDSKGYFTALGKNPKFVEHYLNQEFFNCDVHLSDADVNEEFVLQDTVVHHGATRQLFEDCPKFGLNHVFTILQRNPDSIDAFHFACSKQMPGINEWYLANVQQLKQFIHHFKSHALVDPKLKQAYEHKFIIDYTANGYQTQARTLANQVTLANQIANVNAKRFYLPGSKTQYLTSREVQCLLWLRHGKTYEEIAMILDITERTVRAHTNSIKEKLNCVTLFQMGEKFAQLDLFKNLQISPDKT